MTSKRWVYANEVIDALEATVKQKNVEIAKLKQHQSDEKATLRRSAVHVEQIEALKKVIINEAGLREAEYKRRSEIHRWSIEAVPSLDKQIEGLTAKVWEVEDENLELRYVVIAQVPRGTSTEVNKQWVQDLRRSVGRTLGDAATIVVAPTEATVTIAKIVPGIGEAGIEDDGQF